MQEIKFKSRTELHDYIDNPNNYRLTRYKSYYNWCAMPQLHMNVYSEIQHLHYETDNHTPFILYDVTGDLTAIDEGTLRRKWTFATGELITADSIRGMIKGGVINWFKVKAILPKEPVFAVFIPKGYEFVMMSTEQKRQQRGNSLRDTRHGLGDFVVAASIKKGEDYTPDLTKRHIVRGEVFSRVFNNTCWTDCLEPVVHDYMSAQPPIKIVQYAGM